MHKTIDYILNKTKPACKKVGKHLKRFSHRFLVFVPIAVKNCFSSNVLRTPVALCEANLNSSISSTEFSVPGYLSRFWMDSSVYMHDNGV